MLRRAAILGYRLDDFCQNSGRPYSVILVFKYPKIYYSNIALALYVVCYRVLQAYLIPITEKKSRDAAGNGIVG